MAQQRYPHIFSPIRIGDVVFKTVVPRNVRVSEAPSHGKPALFYDFNSAGAQAYLRVATEVVQKTQKGE